MGLILNKTLLIYLIGAAKELQRALWTNPPPVRLMPGVPRSSLHTFALLIKQSIYNHQEAGREGQAADQEGLR